MKTFRFACRRIVPIIFAYVFVGIAYGILMNDSGYSAWTTILSSVFIYAGSLQIVIVSLLKAGAPLVTIALMTFFVNARLAFYGISFIEEFKRIGKSKFGFIKYPYMALSMTDETYSILCSMECYKGIDKDKAELYVLLLAHLLWILSTALGVMAGKFIPFDMTGIDFSATAFFITIVINQWKEFGSKIPVATGLLSAVLFYFIFGADNFILPALSVSVIALIIMKDRVMLKARL